MNNITPVLIVGAGPVGLSLAIELGRHGIPFRIIDKQIKPVKTSNATVAQTRTLEIWDDMELIDEALPSGHKITGVNLYSGKDKIFNLEADEIKSVYRFVLGIPQCNTETVLLEHLRKQGVNVEMEVELIDCSQSENNVSATLRHKEGKEETINVQYLVGCDGIRSTVRTKLNIDFAGKELDDHFVVADIKLSSESLNPDQTYAILAPDGALIIIPIDKGFTRIVAEVTHDPDETLRASRSPTNEQVKAVLTKRCEFPIKIEDPIWTSGFWIHERMVSTYRKNRIFLAGDACHVHAPLGGQGMNTGIQDVYNLAWKLALVINGKAKDELLESYQKERYSVARAVLDKTTFLTHMMTLRNPILRFIRNHVISFLMKRPKNRALFGGTLTELNVNYQHSAIVKDLLPKTSGPIAGYRMPDVKFDKGRLFDHVRGVQHCLLMFVGINPTANANAAFLNIKQKINEYNGLIKPVIVISQQNANEFAQWEGDVIVDSQLAIHKEYGADYSRLYLIRPDKYISFKGDLSHADELSGYLAAIFS